MQPEEVLNNMNNNAPSVVKLWAAWLPFWASLLWDVWRLLHSGSFEWWVAADIWGKSPLTYAEDQRHPGFEGFFEWLLYFMPMTAFLLALALFATIAIANSKSA